MLLLAWAVMHCPSYSTVSTSHVLSACHITSSNRLLFDNSSLIAACIIVGFIIPLITSLQPFTYTPCIHFTQRILYSLIGENIHTEKRLFFSITSVFSIRLVLISDPGSVTDCKSFLPWGTVGTSPTSCLCGSLGRGFWEKHGGQPLSNIHVQYWFWQCNLNTWYASLQQICSREQKFSNLHSPSSNTSRVVPFLWTHLSLLFCIPSQIASVSYLSFFGCALWQYEN